MGHRTIAAFASPLLAIGLFALPAAAQSPCWVERQKLFTPTAAPNEWTGYTVSVSGDTAVVGSRSRDVFGQDSGSAHVYQRDHGGPGNWGEVTRLFASNAFMFNWFGHAVAIAGDTIVVGALHDDANGYDSGSAYIFRRDHGGADNWGEVKRIEASDSSKRFGNAVAISRDRIVVGAYWSALQRGAVYVFERDQGGLDNWGEVKKLVASDGLVDDGFGVSVSVSGATIVVGQWNQPDVFPVSGSAYVFERDQGGAGNWGEVTKLLATDFPNHNGDAFGRHVALHQDTLAVGAPDDSDWVDGVGWVTTTQGTVYVYGRNEGGSGAWGQLARLFASDAGSGDGFGVVSVWDDTLAVGSPGDDDGQAGSGSVYLFERDAGGADNWGETQKLVASDAAVPIIPGSAFGSSVSVTSGALFSGSPFDDHDVNLGVHDCGSSYAFDLSSCGGTTFCFGDGSGTACPCRNSGAAGHGCENSFATGGALLVAEGEVSVAFDALVLRASGLPPTAPALFFQGTQQVNGGLGDAFGDGLRCVGGTVRRLGTHAAVAGETSYPLAGDAPVSVKGLLPVAGGVRHYQAWYRNIADYCTADGFNLTNAVEVSWAP